MKRSIAIFALALLPALAQAQTSAYQAAAGTGVDVPVTLQAQVVQPVVFSRPARTIPPPAAAPAPPPPAPHDAVEFQLESDPAATADLNTGAITARFGSSEPETTAPKLIHVVGRTLPVQRLLSQENNAHVVVRLIVGDNGLPQSLSVVHSAGAEIDQETLAAVRQYRFTPAIVNHVPVKSEVTVTVVLKK
jgi:TonB family protein